MLHGRKLLTTIEFYTCKHISSKNSNWHKESASPWQCLLICLYCGTQSTIVKSKVKQIAMMKPVFVCDPLATTHKIGLIASGLLCLHEVNVELDLYKSIIACLA